LCCFDFWIFILKHVVPWLKHQPAKLVFILYFNHGNNIKKFLRAKLEAFYWCCVDFASKFSPFNNSPITKYIPFTMDMLPVILIRFWPLSPLCKHLQFLSHHHGHYSIKKIAKSPPSHTNFSQLCYSIHELCSHLNN
jgi:hypothetical protein